MTSLLSAIDARITVDGVVAIERLNYESVGDRVLFGGDATALFAALTSVPLGLRGAAAATANDEDPPPLSEAAIVVGSIRIAGRRVELGEHTRITGMAPLDPPLPPSWSSEEYVAWSARLGGASSRSAKELAASALTRVGLAAIRKKRLSQLSLPERRALVLAHAFVLGPDVIVAESPLASLDGIGAEFVLRAIGAVTEGRAAILSATRLDAASPESVLARGASHIAVLSGGEIAFEGGAHDLFSGARQYMILVRSNGAAFRAEAAARGIDLRGGPTRFSAALPAGASSRELLLASQSALAPILELTPLVG